MKDNRIISKEKTEKGHGIQAYVDMVKNVEKSFKDEKSTDEYLAESRTDRIFN